MSDRPVILELILGIILIIFLSIKLGGVGYYLLGILKFIIVDGGKKLIILTMPTIKNKEDKPKDFIFKNNLLFISLICIFGWPLTLVCNIFDVLFEVD